MILGLGVLLHTPLHGTLLGLLWRKLKNQLLDVDFLGNHFLVLD